MLPVSLGKQSKREAQVKSIYFCVRNTHGQPLKKRRKELHMAQVKSHVQCLVQIYIGGLKVAFVTSSQFIFCWQLMCTTEFINDTKYAMNHWFST